jgi:hypothetical protein
LAADWVRSRQQEISSRLAWEDHATREPRCASEHEAGGRSLEDQWATRRSGFLNRSLHGVALDLHENVAADGIIA